MVRFVVIGLEISEGVDIHSDRPSNILYTALSHLRKVLCYLHSIFVYNRYEDINYLNLSDYQSSITNNLSTFFEIRSGNKVVNWFTLNEINMIFINIII